MSKRHPLPLKGMFEQWLMQHEPLKAAHVLQRLYDTRGGKAYDAAFGEATPLDCSRFVPPRTGEDGPLSLFQARD